MRTLSVILLAAALAPSIALSAQQPPKPVAPARADLLTSSLFLSLTDHDHAATVAALKAGADPIRRNWLGMTPLTWASFMGESESVRLLLARGAKLNDGTIFGSALTQAALGNHDSLACFLLDKGAGPNPSRIDQTTPLMIASSNGCTSLIRRLLSAGVDPNRRNVDGSSALTFAARGNQAEAARLLLASGARVDSPDKLGRTPLHYAAANGSAALAKLLISKGAAASAVDAAGATPLHLAARYSGNGETIRSLLLAGARPTRKDGRGKTPRDLAASRGYREAAGILQSAVPAGTKSTAYADPAATEDVIRPAMGAIQKSMRAFADRSDCVSCHHQGLGLIVLARAAKRGIPIDGKLVGAYMNRLAEDGKRGSGAIHAAVVDPSATKAIPAVDIGDFSYGAGYFLNALHENGVPPNPGVAEAARVLGSLQKPDGSWRFGAVRGAMQKSNVMTTALALQALNVYWPEEMKSDFERRAANATAWLNSVKLRSSEDMAARVLGLKAAGADPQVVAKAAQLLLSTQRPDGGWRFPNAPGSDAYTTGLSLYTLRTAAGLPADSAAVHRAVDFLRRTQDEDGTWYVAKATEAYNNHFDAAFPHGYSQYASFAGTCWAVLGLLESVESRTASR